MIKILITGDFSPQERVSRLFEANDWATVLSDIKSLNEGMDYCITNFESTVADKYDVPIVKSGPHLRCTEKFAQALRWAKFDMVTLANNHFYDYGQNGDKITAINKKPRA